MKFTIITGPGRCGTSALTEFFINSNLYRVDYIGGKDPLMKILSLVDAADLAPLIRV
jgi:hypothetical protein